MNRTRLRVALLGPVLGLAIGFGCVGEVERTYFDDLRDASTDGTVLVRPDASSTDAPTGPGDDAQPMTDDASGDGGAFDGGPVKDGSVAPDCGPTTSPTNCGACGNTCDGVHTDASPTCDGVSCNYGACGAGWGDCVKAAPNTVGCETPLNTTLNCTACGAACDTAHSLDAGCNGTACTYGGCSAGWVDCVKTAPNANGCETPVSATVHNNGLDQLYNDCTPVGTYSAALALKACIAYTDAASQCVGFPCQDPDSGPIICSAGALTKNCMCWSYSGDNVGLIDNGGQPPGNSAQHCFCPDKKQGDTPWN